MSKWSGVVRTFKNTSEMMEEFGDGHYVVGSPPQRKLEAKIADFMGRPVLTTTRGMTAIEAVTFNVATAGATILCSEDVYPGTWAFFNELISRRYVKKAIRFDPTDEAMFQTLLRQNPGTAFVFTETFGNAYRMRVARISALARICQPAAVPLIVDTTFTPLYKVPREPLVIGVCSMTKYHQPEDQTMGGFISADESIIASIARSRMYLNRAMTPSQARYYSRPGVYDETTRRYCAHSRVAERLACVAYHHGAVAHVWYPGLTTHPDVSVVIDDHHCSGGGVFYLQTADGSSQANQLTNALVSAFPEHWELCVSYGSSKNRVFPFIGEKFEKMAGATGIIRIASGRMSARTVTKQLKTALDSL